jgi:hypothetical protein
MSLLAKLLDARGLVRVYGTTPPRAGSPPEVVETAAAKLVERVKRLPLDGLVVYDIQDESSRISTPRPFPYMRTIDPRSYSKLLTARSRIPAITYKSIGLMTVADWSSWLDETGAQFGVEHLCVVGRPTSGAGPYPLSLDQAIELAVGHPHDYTVGGVVIAERHATHGGEGARMLAKIARGCKFFVSQTVYHPGDTVDMLADYARECTASGTPPRRVVLTFAPVGREKTMAFMKWLGIDFAPETERAILGAPSPLAKSIEISCANLSRILDQPYVDRIPLGINVESVSINREEIDASIDLFDALAGVLTERLARGG